MPAQPDAPLTVTWLGHSSTLIELEGVRLMTDPILGRRIGPLVRIAPPVPPGPVCDVDAVLISHLHADHADLGSLRRLGAHIIAPSGSARWLARKGLRDVEELRVGEETRVGAVRISATPAQHDGRRWRDGARADTVGFVAAGSQRCYFAGDTDLYPGMSELAGSIDLALLPVWGWGSRLGPGHLDPERAATATRMIAPRVAVPIHWGTFVLRRPGKRPGDPAVPARRFSELAARVAPSVEVRVLAPGARTELRVEPRSEAGPRVRK
jgi:L-ascorbate metabolism protein UlaG (beta-lactamase superfamily)